MKTINRFLTLILVSLIFISCDPNDDSINNNNTGGTSAAINYNFGSNVSRDFFGEIVDENENPIQNATVSIGSISAQTDVNGIFIIKNATVKSNFAFIKVTKNGYLKGSRTVVPTNGDNRVNIMMLSATVVGTVSTGSAGTVTLPNGTKVDFDGSFKKQDGTAYSGTVSVMMHHLDPSDPNVNDKMPGMLLAANTNGEARILETYGMINVELVGSGGEKLQIANSATIEMPIATSQTGVSPSSIPLWHFDEVNGYWVEEGAATKVGTKYVGSVSHFSWWNCDAQFPTVTLCLKVVNPNNQPLSGVVVELQPSNQTYPRSGTSNASGDICGLVPANQTMTMIVRDNCGNAISTSTVGPFSSNSTLPNIVLTTGMVQQTVVQGLLTNCNNSNVTNGYIVLEYGNNTLIQSVTNGTFSFNALVCNPSSVFTVEGYDYDNFQSTGQLNYTFSTPTTNIGTLITCSSVTEYITYQIDNEPVDYYIGPFSSGATPNGLAINSQGASGTNNFYFQGNIFATGTYTTPSFLIENAELTIGSSSPNTITLTVSQIGSVGGYIDVSFSGTFTANDSSTKSISGVMHVIRDN